MSSVLKQKKNRLNFEILLARNEDLLVRPNYISCWANFCLTKTEHFGHLPQHPFYYMPDSLCSIFSSFFALSPDFTAIVPHLSLAAQFFYAKKSAFLLLKNWKCLAVRKCEIMTPLCPSKVQYALLSAQGRSLTCPLKMSSYKFVAKFLYAYCRGCWSVHLCRRTSY